MTPQDVLLKVKRLNESNLAQVVGRQGDDWDHLIDRYFANQPEDATFLKDFDFVEYQSTYFDSEKEYSEYDAVIHHLPSNTYIKTGYSLWPTGIIADGHTTAHIVTPRTITKTIYE